jgi:hypothetical protein
MRTRFIESGGTRIIVGGSVLTLESIKVLAGMERRRKKAKKLTVASSGW